MRVLVGSANPVKIAAVRDAFEPYFPGAEVEGIETPSGVPAQPVGEDDLHRRGESGAGAAGAECRARAWPPSFASGWRAASRSIMAGGLPSASFASPTRRAGWGSAFRRCSSCRRVWWTICWGETSWAM